MKKEIADQYNICWQLSNELDFASSYYSAGNIPFAAHHEIIKNKLKSFFEVCTDDPETYDDDLNIITRIRIETEYLVEQMRAQLTVANGTIDDPAQQKDIINNLVDLQIQIDALNYADKIKFKLPLTIANRILQKITTCQNNNESLQYRLSSLAKRDSNSTSKGSTLTIFFHSSNSNSKNLKTQLAANKLQLAKLVHQLIKPLLNIFRIQQTLNLDLQANNSVVKFRTNSHVLAFAEDAKRRPAFTSSALGFVKE